MNDLAHIAHESVGGDRKHWRFGITVDGNDDAGVFHAGQVLHGSRNTESDMQLRGNHLAGLPDLPFVWGDSGIHQRARASCCSIQSIGQTTDVLLEFLASPKGPAT